MPQSSIPWLEKKLKFISVEREELDHLSKLGKDIADESQPWSPLKLIFLRYVASIYTNIISSRFRNMYYVDLFSGSGLSKIKGSEDLCLGSPLLINKLPQSKKFRCMLLNDSDQKKIEALNCRLQETKNSPFFTGKGDCNEAFNVIEEDIGHRGSHSLIFLDPYSTELSWKTMEKILNVDADVIFLYQTMVIPRGIAVCKKDDASLKKFFASYKEAVEVYNHSPEGTKPEALLNLYKKDIKETKGYNTILEDIRIKGPNFYYDILFITKRTMGGSPWMDSIREGKKQIETNTSLAVRRTMDIIKQRQSKLGDFP